MRRRLLLALFQLSWARCALDDSPNGQPYAAFADGGYVRGASPANTRDAPGRVIRVRGSGAQIGEETRHPPGPMLPALDVPQAAAVDAEVQPPPSPPRIEDAGAREPLDAASDPQPASDATVTASSPDTGEPGTAPCSGVQALDLCWHLGRPGQSCSGVCNPLGGFDARSISLVGTWLQGGAIEHCTEVLRALDAADVVTEAYRPDGIGVGCHRWGVGAYWLPSSSSPFEATARLPDAEIACACSF